MKVKEVQYAKALYETTKNKNQNEIDEAILNDTLFSKPTLSNFFIISIFLLCVVIPSSEEWSNEPSNHPVYPHSGYVPL